MDSSPSTPRQRRRICLNCDSIFQPPDKYYGHFCENCRNDTHRAEAHRLLVAILRAQQHGTPATITLHGWLETLEYFGWKCAYCQTGPYEVVEHVLELTRGGGSTKGNLVPACRQCNRIKDLYRKGTYIGKEKFQASLERIDLYLTQFLSEYDVPFLEVEDERPLSDLVNIIPFAVAEKPWKEENIHFRGWTLRIALLYSGNIVVSLQSLCSLFGAYVSGQLARIQGSGHMSGHIRRVFLISNGGVQTTNCLDVELMQTWIDTISPTKLELKSKELAHELQIHRRFAISIQIEDPELRFELIVRFLTDREPSERNEATYE